MTVVRMSPQGTVAVRDETWGGKALPWRVVYVPAGVADWPTHLLTDQAVASWDVMAPRRQEVTS